MTKICGEHYTAEELDAMRTWTEDAATQAIANYGLEVDDLDDEDIVIGVANNYEGGITAFLDDLHDAA